MVRYEIKSRLPCPPDPKESSILAVQGQVRGGRGEVQTTSRQGKLIVDKKHFMSEETNKTKQ